MLLFLSLLLSPLFMSLLIPRAISVLVLSFMLIFAPYIYELFYGFSPPVAGLLMGIRSLGGLLGAVAALLIAGRVDALTQYRLTNLVALPFGAALIVWGIFAHSQPSLMPVAAFAIKDGMPVALNWFGL